MSDETKDTTAADETQPAEKPATKSDGVKADVPARVAPTDEELEAKRAALRAQLAELEPKPVPIEELSDDQLHLRFVDAIHELLGAHPRLEPIVSEIRKRINRA